MNFKDTTNCISSNDRLIDCVLKWKKYSIVFYAKGSKTYIKAVTKQQFRVNVEQNQLTNEKIECFIHSKTHTKLHVLATQSFGPRSLCPLCSEAEVTRVVGRTLIKMLSEFTVS